MAALPSLQSTPVFTQVPFLQGHLFTLCLHKSSTMHCGNVCWASSTANPKQTWAWIQSFLPAEVITLRSAPSLSLGIKFERRDRTWEAEALNYIPFKDNLDLFLLTRSVTAHLDRAHMRSPRNPFPPWHSGCSFMKGAQRTAPAPLFASGEPGAMAGSRIYQDRHAFYYICCQNFA